MDVSAGVYICVSVCMKVCVYMCIDRPAGKQLSPRGNSQPRFTSGRAKLSNYRSQLCQNPPLFLSKDGMTGLHPLTHTHTHASLPFSLLVVHLPPCSPGQLNSYQRSWALFFQKANPTPVSRLYTGNRGLCECECMSTVCVWGRECNEGSVFFRKGDSLCFCEIKSKNKEIVCAWLLCVRIWEWTYGDHKADCILFSGNGVSKDILGIDGVLFCRGVRLVATQRSREHSLYYECYPL